MWLSVQINISRRNISKIPIYYLSRKPWRCCCCFIVWKETYKGLEQNLQKLQLFKRPALTWPKVMFRHPQAMPWNDAPERTEWNSPTWLAGSARFVWTPMTYHILLCACHTISTINVICLIEHEKATTLVSKNPRRLSRLLLLQLPKIIGQDRFPMTCVKLKTLFGTSVP